MAKQEQQQTEKKPEQVPKKKIIKKFPLVTLNKNDALDDLKGWKPTKKLKKQEPKVDSMQKQQKNIASTFLNSLSRPTNLNSKKPGFGDDLDEIPVLNIKPKVNMVKPTPEQIKWDIEDKSFMVNNFTQQKQIQKQIINEQQMPEEKFVILDEKGRTQKVRQIDISKIVDKNWQQNSQVQAMRQELYGQAQGVLQGGKLAKIAKEAQSRANEIEQSLNKREYEKKQIRSRYGW